MSNRTIQIDDRLYEYLLQVSLREAPLLAELRQETMQLEMARMQIAPEQGQFMAMLLRLLGARRCLEVGTFTGYSALSFAMAMPDDSLVVTLDNSEEWTAIARRYWQRAALHHRIELRFGEAMDSLRDLLQEDAPSFDFMFIDADKTGYKDYIELGLQLVRTGGVIALDNTLWGGRVADDAIQDKDTRAIRALNSALHADPRFELSLVPVADGLTLLLKN